MNKNIPKPVRVQRQITKGWKMPENTVYVGRPTKWGNPVKLHGDTVYVNASHRREVLSEWVALGRGCSLDDLVYLYAQLFKVGFQNKDVQFWAEKFKKLDLSELKGKNLACFCPLHKPCHVDILLKIVNEV